MIPNGSYSVLSKIASTVICHIIHNTHLIQISNPTVRQQIKPS